MKFRHAFISLGDSHVVAMAFILPAERKGCVRKQRRLQSLWSQEIRIRTFTARQQGALTMSSISDLTPGIWNVDPVHSSIGFVARHLMVSKVRGRFGSFTGTVTIAEDPLQSKVEATADIPPPSTAGESAETHLNSADFFNAEQIPTIPLVSPGIEPDGHDYVLHTNLPINGVTKPVDFELEFEGV